MAGNNVDEKQTPASLEYSRAVKADPAAFYKEKTAKTEMTPIEQARHKAFLDGHPLAREQDA